jgi:hypothetical protein
MLPTLLIEKCPCADHAKNWRRHQTKAGKGYNPVINT